jgi:hypothetical protein
VSAQPSMRELATEMATLSEALTEISAKLGELKQDLFFLSKMGTTTDGLSLTDNIGKIKRILVEQFGE